MALADMMVELRGAVPKIPISYCKTLVNRAWGEIRTANLWSFQLLEWAWISPPLITSGTVTTVQGSDRVTFDAAAIAALVSLPYSFITQRQFRIGSGGIYSIVGFDNLTGTAILDRMFADPAGSGQSYQVYQVYYPAPVKDFRTIMTLTNPQLFMPLCTTKTRSQIDEMDPQRMWLAFPSHVVGIGRDLRGLGKIDDNSNPLDSATLNFPLYELWGQPTQLYTYQGYGIRLGADLDGPDDELPLPITEDLVMMKAKVSTYEWALANMELSPRSEGPDWKFLMGMSEAAYKKRLSNLRRDDKEFVDNWFSSRGLNGGAMLGPYYNSVAQRAGAGAPW